jgi:hypothetical protein
MCQLFLLPCPLNNKGKTATIFVLSQVVNYLQKCDQTPPTIKYPKHPKKGENKEQNGRTHIQENK